jgi:hypothetical protein
LIWCTNAIQDKRHVIIKTSPGRLFDFIETMPNKFPVCKILETKPIFFLRILLVDGFRSAIEAMGVNEPDHALILAIGDSLGPFTLTESARPYRYRFTLKSFFFNCKTGYSLSFQDHSTALSLDLIAENPTFFERLWWFFNHIRIESADQEAGMDYPIFVGRAIRKGQDMDSVYLGKFIDLVDQISDIEHGPVRTVKPEMATETIFFQIFNPKSTERLGGRRNVL